MMAYVKGKGTSPNLPYFCPSCDNEGDVWVTRVKEVPQFYHGHLYRVPDVEVTECYHCRFGILTDEQADALVRKTKAMFDATLA